ncbi:hypothetical protein FSP39_013566 [Pinctada imbricata]|uniref:B box-type domain-containing protein n=1 Tax=Pinctada imbricata TaxID=66713 RepID=A0AA89C7I8_PINIB|nr:hypothetical protein FSP39_013566 [Pinctada imbricata]
MAASLCRAQYVLKLCEKHDKKELQAFCKTCVEKICSSCIKEEHNSHDWDLITDIVREKKRSLPLECQEIRTKQLPGLRDDICRFGRKIEEEGTRLQENKSVLNDSRQSYINRINQLFDDRVDEFEEKSEAAIQIYKGKRDALKQKVEFLDMMSTALDKDIDILPDHDILDMEKEMRDELEKALSYSSETYSSTTLFVPGQMNVEALEEMIGDIKSFSINEEYDIDRYSETIMSLKPVSDTDAFIIIGEKLFAKAKMIDRTGVEMKTLKTPCIDFAVLKNDTMVLTDYQKGIILVLTQDEDKIRTINTKPLRPTYISKTENDDLLVTLVDRGGYNLVSTSRRIVQRMTLTGKVLHTYEFKEDGKTRLFTLPVRKAENKNSDICIINRHDSDSGELIVLHKDGRVKFIYSGEDLDDESFLPFDIECDSKSHILLTEKYSRAIHVLSAEGIFLRTLFHHHLHPAVISLHGDNLWCGFFEGRVKVFEYKK